MSSKLKHIIKQNKGICRILRILYRIPLTLYWNLRFLYDGIFKRNEIYGCCFVFTTFLGRIKKNNWGDDLNDHLFMKLGNTKIKFVPFDQLFFSSGVQRYSLIGSIIGDFNLNHTVIYGSGAISDNAVLNGVPLKVLSVRGPLTRQVLIRNGIDCPEIYGDPALLLPFVYKPLITKKYRIGIIPHYRTFESEDFSSLKTRNDIVVIDMSRYEKWTDVIDEIVSCDVILSESLHGLIVSECYKIPSLWVEFIEHNYYFEWDFKFRDFYLSIGKDDQKCYKTYQGYSIEELAIMAREWQPGEIDFESMLRVFPFEISVI